MLHCHCSHCLIASLDNHMLRSDGRRWRRLFPHWLRSRNNSAHHNRDKPHRTYIPLYGSQTNQSALFRDQILVEKNSSGRSKSSDYHLNIRIKATIRILLTVIEPNTNLFVLIWIVEVC
jgi:hypothetical protein